MQFPLPTNTKTSGVSSVSRTEYQSTVFSEFPDEAKRTARDHPEAPNAK
jgi:hypothetical protein